MVDGGQYGDLFCDLAAVYELAGHALTSVQQLTAFLFHQAESLRLIGTKEPEDLAANAVTLAAYVQGSKTYLHNVVEGSAGKRRRVS